jgi:DNA polymerase (family 10)
MGASGLPGGRVNKKEIAQVLDEMALLMDIRGENPFKVRAYANAARLLTGLDPAEFDQHVREGTLGSVRGIGKNLSARIHGLAEEGFLYEFEDLKKSVPPGLILMLQIPGLGPKKIKAVYEQLRLDTVADLETACREGRVQSLPGFGAKTEARILAGIRQLAERSGRYLFSLALEAAERLMAALSGTPEVGAVHLAGSLRRGQETVRDIDLAVATRSPEAVGRALAVLPGVREVRAAGPGVFRVALVEYPPADVVCCPPERLGTTLFLATGSRAHLSGPGGGGEAREEEAAPEVLPALPDFVDEEALYRSRGCAWIPPELREGWGEWEAARDGALPELVREADVRGVVHAHSTYSDGADTVEAMARACREAGYGYLVLCDHSRSAFYAGGLPEEAVLRQHDEIDRLNGGLAPFRILKGIETEILRDGSLDYPDEFLSRFEFVIASIHSSFQMPREEMTARILRALAHPMVDLVGHPTGRLVLGRPGYQVDVDALIDGAARWGKALELNAHPYRLDLDWRRCRQARERGVPVSINPDAHETAGIRDIRYGVMVARKGWLRREDVLNARGWEELLAWRKARGQA